MPFLDWGACPFECCAYGSWTATQPTNVLARRSTAAATAFQLDQGEQVTALTGVVVTTSAGRLRARTNVVLGEGREAVSLRRGDLIYILHYLGEGYDLLWYNGHTLSDQIEPIESFGELELLEPARTEWWVKVKNRAGRIGWSAHPEDFGGKDVCDSR